MLQSRRRLQLTNLTDPQGADHPERRGKAHIVGLRDRALIGFMVYTFARVNAALQMKVGDYFVQGRRGWLRTPRPVFPLSPPAAQPAA